MYGKIFKSIFDSTLVAEGGWLPTYIFIAMCVEADKNGVADIAPRALYRRMGFSDFDSKISYDDFVAAIEYLEKDDPSSRSPEENGRRIIPLSALEDHDGNRGFLIVNYDYYRDKGGSIEKRRENDAARKRRQRKRENKELNENTPNCHVTVTAGHGESAHIDIDTDIDTDKERETRTREDVMISDLRKAPRDFEPPQSAVEKVKKDTGMDDEAIRLHTLTFKSNVFKSRQFSWIDSWFVWMYRETSFKRPSGSRRSTGSYHDEIDEAIKNADQ